MAAREADRGGRPIQETLDTAAPDWDGWNDPFFREALCVIDEVVEHISVDAQGILKAMMAYLLLWSVVERFLEFRYGLGLKIRTKLAALAEEKSIHDALDQVLDRRSRSVIDRDLRERALKEFNYVSAVDYYYAVRSMAVHRGKATQHDASHITASLRELRKIFGVVFDAAKEEADLAREEFSSAR